MSELEGQSTGEPRVDGVLRTLETLADRPVAEHVGVFEAAHTALREALTDPVTDPLTEPVADPLTDPQDGTGAADTAPATTHP